MSTKQSNQAVLERKKKKTTAEIEEKRRLNRRNKEKRLEGETATKEERKARTEKRKRAPRVRLFPIWLRIVVVLILCAFALVAGLTIGYGVMGDGAPADVLKVETWKHIIDIVIKE